MYNLKMLLDLFDIHQKNKFKFFGVIHVGAHYGQEKEVYDSLNIPFENRYYFEPNPEAFNRLIKNCNIKEKCYNLALGNKNGFSEMFIEKANGGQSSSLLKPKLHLNQYPNIKFENFITVPVRKIDDLKIDFMSNFINVDIQGYELEFFKGAKKTLEQIDFILTEVNRAELYEQCAQVNEIDDFLKKFNFERITTNWAGGNWGDAFYIKRSL
jgi:FkbM family methyltransferase